MWTGLLANSPKRPSDLGLTIDSIDDGNWIHGKHPKCGSIIVICPAVLISVASHAVWCGNLRFFISLLCESPEFPWFPQGANQLWFLAKGRWKAVRCLPTPKFLWSGSKVARDCLDESWTTGTSLTTWWFIPLTKWLITPIVGGLILLIPVISGVITHLVSGMNHQVVGWTMVNPIPKSIPTIVVMWDSHHPQSQELGIFGLPTVEKEGLLFFFLFLRLCCSASLLLCCSFFFVFPAVLLLCFFAFLFFLAVLRLCFSAFYLSCFFACFLHFSLLFFFFCSILSCVYPKWANPWETREETQKKP